MVTDPADTELTIPEPDTMATVLSLLVQVPPGVPSLRVTELPLHIWVGPLIAPGTGDAFTFTPTVALAVPQLLVTV